MGWFNHQLENNQSVLQPLIPMPMLPTEAIAAAFPTHKTQPSVAATPPAKAAAPLGCVENACMATGRLKF